MMRKHTFSTLAVTALLAFGLSACGSGGKNVASGTTPGVNAPGGSATGAGSDQDKEIQFARCMRANGVNMPDPEPGGMIKMSQGPGDDPHKMEAAQQKCRKYMPNGGTPPKLSQADAAKMREFAKCMRQHGVPMEDPGSDGAVKIKMTAGSGDSGPSLDDQTAQKACQHLMPQMRGKG